MSMNSEIFHISVIIPCYKHKEELKNCLEALHNQKCDLNYEIIVVDSEPSDSIKNIANKFPDIKLIRGNKNLKPGAARNLGVNHARSSYIAFVDSDCIPGHNWVQYAFESLEQGHKLVGGPIVDELPFHPVSSIDNLLQFVDYSVKRPSGLANHIPACNSAVPKVVFNSVGYFPETAMAAGEDVFFSQNIARMFPNSIWFNKNMIVTHLGRKQISMFLEHQESFGFARGYYNLMLKDVYSRFVRFKIIIVPVMIKRFEYIMRKTMLYDPKLIVRNIILSPLILLGLFYWALGFHKGCKQRIENNNK